MYWEITKESFDNIARACGVSELRAGSFQAQLSVTAEGQTIKFGGISNVFRSLPFYLHKTV